MATYQNVSVGHGTNDHGQAAPDVTVTDNPDELRYELHVDGQLAGLIRYRREPGARALVYVDVEPRFEGHGLGTRLVEGALDDLREHGLDVIPHAIFVANFIRRRPEYADLVTAEIEVSD